MKKFYQFVAIIETRKQCSILPNRRWFKFGRIDRIFCKSLVFVSIILFMGLKTKNELFVRFKIAHTCFSNIPTFWALYWCHGHGWLIDLWRTRNGILYPLKYFDFHWNVAIAKLNYLYEFVCSNMHLSLNKNLRHVCTCPQLTAAWTIRTWHCSAVQG